MKKSLTLLVAAFTMYSCGNNNANNNASSEKPTAELQYDTLCFQKVSGNSSQDTATIQLLIQGETVTGRFSNVPFEKDARVGTLSGTKKNELIMGTWTFSQEGMADSMQVEFKLSGNNLLQKEYKIDSKTGREVLTGSSKFSIVFDKIRCPD